MQQTVQGLNKALSTKNNKIDTVFGYFFKHVVCCRLCPSEELIKLSRLSPKLAMHACIHEQTRTD